MQTHTHTPAPTAKESNLRLSIPSFNTITEEGITAKRACSGATDKTPGGFREQKVQALCATSRTEESK